MLRALRSHFQARAVRRAQAARADALQPLQRALMREDTRGEHIASRPAVMATCAELAACIGKSPSAWRRKELSR